MTSIKERLRSQLNKRREEESNNEGRLYYTPKQSRVIRAMADNLGANAETVADEAECHPSYVTYIMKRIEQSILERILENEPVPEVNWTPEENIVSADSDSSDEEVPEAFSKSSDGETVGNQTTVANITPSDSDSSAEIESDTMTIQSSQKIPLTLTLEIPVDQIQEALIDAFGEIDQEELIDDTASIEIGAKNDPKRGMTAQPTMKQVMGMDLTDEDE